jgi:hypothetical protein
VRPGDFATDGDEDPPEWLTDESAGPLLYISFGMLFTNPARKPAWSSLTGTEVTGPGLRHRDRTAVLFVQSARHDQSAGCGTTASRMYPGTRK